MQLLNLFRKANWAVPYLSRFKYMNWATSNLFIPSVNRVPTSVCFSHLLIFFTHFPRWEKGMYLLPCKHPRIFLIKHKRKTLRATQCYYSSQTWSKYALVQSLLRFKPKVFMQLKSTKATLKTQRCASTLTNLQFILYFFCFWITNSYNS